MKKTLLAAAVISMPGLTGAALAADLALKAPVGPAPAFSWSGCYAGVHGGGAFASTDLTDPVALLATGSAASGGTTGASPSGGVVGGQLGCDYQFAPNWVAGIEGSASASTQKGGTTVGLGGGDQAVVSATNNFLPNVTGRLGYAVDRMLFYGRAGVAWANVKYDVTGSYLGTPFAFEGLDTRAGWTAGAGVEWAFSRNWSVNMEYDYYSFDTGTMLLTDSISGSTGPLDARQNVQVIKAGVNFHIWSGR